MKLTDKNYPLVNLQNNFFASNSIKKMCRLHSLRHYTTSACWDMFYVEKQTKIIRSKGGKQHKTSLSHEMAQFKNNYRCFQYFKEDRCH